MAKIKKETIQRKWQEQRADALRKAEQMAPGPERYELLRMARQLKTASHMNDWLNSPELKRPE